MTINGRFRMVVTINGRFRFFTGYEEKFATMMQLARNVVANVITGAFFCRFLSVNVIIK